MKLTDVKGIKTETAKALRAAGINSLDDLIAADAAMLESKIGIVTVDQIKEWKLLASVLVVADEIKGMTRVKVIAPDGVYLPEHGARMTGEFFDLDAAYARQLLEAYPQAFQEQEVSK